MMYNVNVKGYHAILYCSEKHVNSCYYLREGGVNSEIYFQSVYLWVCVCQGVV